jgi:GcrA cell cycle regulator
LLTTIALTIDTCRWPFGDPVAADFHYCGEPPLIDGPYCEVHHSKSYQPVRSRRAAA